MRTMTVHQVCTVDPHEKRNARISFTNHNNTTVMKKLPDPLSDRTYVFFIYTSIYKWQRSHYPLFHHHSR